MPTAVYALIGTVFGASIAALTTWSLELRREQAQASSAALLLAVELRNALEATWEIRFDDRWPTGWKRDWSAAWRSARGSLLARPPHGDTLARVAAACARLDQLENAVNDGNLAQQPLTGENKLFLWRMQQLLDAACQALPSASTGPFEKMPSDPRPGDLAQWQAA